jgi:hypothetical protein
MARGTKRKMSDIETWCEAMEPYLRMGLTIKVACMKLKIPYTTLRDYMKRDEGIRIRLNAAKASFYDTLQTSVFNQASVDGKLALDVLARIDKKRYALRVESTGKRGEALNTVQPIVDALDRLNKTKKQNEGSNS